MVHFPVLGYDDELERVLGWADVNGDGTLDWKFLSLLTLAQVLVVGLCVD